MLVDVYSSDHGSVFFLILESAGLTRTTPEAHSGVEREDWSHYSRHTTACVLYAWFKGGSSILALIYCHFPGGRILEKVLSSTLCAVDYSRGERRDDLCSDSTTIEG